MSDMTDVRSPLSSCRIALIGDSTVADAGWTISAERHAARALPVARAGRGPHRHRRLLHQFGEGGGVTGVVVLAESHLAIHTWPEKMSVTVDVYVCNYGSDNREKARRRSTRCSSLLHPRSLAYAPSIGFSRASGSSRRRKLARSAECALRHLYQGRQLVASARSPYQTLQIATSRYGACCASTATR